MIGTSNKLLAAALAITVLTTPLAAQQLTSDSFAFLEAVKKRDGNKATELLDQQSTTVVNARERGNGEGALHIVARGRDLNWLGFLIGKGARVDIQNRDGNTPLGLAAQIGWVEGAQVLLSRGATVDLSNSRGETPLIFAVHRRDMATARILLAAGADPRKTDSAAGYSAIDYAKRDPRAGLLVRMLETPRKPARPVAGPAR